LQRVFPIFITFLTMVKSKSDQKKRLKREAKRQGVSFALVKKNSTSSCPVDDSLDGKLAAGVRDRQGGAASCKGAAGTAAAIGVFSLPLHQDFSQKSR
jgi:hypothetical protein